MSATPSIATVGKKVGDVFKVVGGGTPATANPNFWNGTIPWVTSADLDGDLGMSPRKAVSPEAIGLSATNLVPAGSVIVATRVGLGKVGIAATDLCFSQDCHGLIFNPEICDSSFVAHQLKLRVQVFKRISRGTTIAGVTKKQLLDVPFDLPPIDEQRQIVAEIEKQFTRLEAGIAALRRVQANLKRYRAAVLKAACEGRLVPTEAELARKEGRAYESADKLLARILTERREKWNGRGKYKEPMAPDTPIDTAFPEGWTWTGFEQLSDGSRHAIKAGPFGSALKKSFYTTSGFKIYGQEQVIKGDPYFGDYFISAERFKDLENCSVEAGDILVSLVGTTGKVLILPKDCAPGIINPRLLKLSLNRDGVSPKFVKILLESSQTRAFFKLAAHGGTMEILNLGILKSLPIAFPPFAEQKRIVAEVERLLSVVEEQEAVVSANLKRAARLRQTILASAFSPAAQ